MNGQIYELQINQSLRIKSGWMSRTNIIFAGMINETTFSLIVTHTNVHNSIAYNLYIPKSQGEVMLIKGRLVVQRVSPTQISFRIEEPDQKHGKVPI